MLKRLRREPGFYRRLTALVLPMVLQNIITNALGFIDTFMVGLVGSSELSAVTAANTPVFLLQGCVFGLMSGLMVMVTQYWGRQDIESINRCMGVILYISFGLSAFAAAVLFFFPTQVMSFITNNPLLIELGAPYLKIVGVGYIFNAASSVYVGVQRSTENPAFGMKVFGCSMLLNTLLNYILIFGKFGAPALGITGAALATTLSRVAEFLIVISYAAHNRRVPLMPRALLRPGMEYLRRTLRYSGPVVFNETFWGAGFSMITVIMGHMAGSADMLAAYAVMGNVDKFAVVACIGVANASSVIVGKRIGEGASREEVYNLGVTLLLCAVLCGVGVALLLMLLLPTVFIPVIYPLFDLSPQAVSMASMLCVVYAVVMPTRSFDVANVTGVLRAGGDTRFAALLDTLPLWLGTVPVMALLALVLDAPIPLICAATQMETLIKFPVGILRLRSCKWINNVTIG